MELNYKANIKTFDIENTPDDFDPDMLKSETLGESWFNEYSGRKRGRRRYVIIYVKNRIGQQFFFNPIGNGETDYLWDFVCFQTMTVYLMK